MTCSDCGRHIEVPAIMEGLNIRMVCRTCVPAPDGKRMRQSVEETQDNARRLAGPNARKAGAARKAGEANEAWEAAVEKAGLR